MEKNMLNNKYLMEHEEETLRLELKTDLNVVRKQATWAGLKSGMRVADLGCGPGITTSILHELVSPNGEAVGIELSEQMCQYAKANYKTQGLEFLCRDIREPLEDLGEFDFIWVRFILEYYLNGSSDIIKNIYNVLKPRGILCLIDLDHNCLNHFGIPERLEKTILEISEELQIKANFDPYAGRKLYSYLYDLDFKNIEVDISAHHNIYGQLKDVDEYNFLKKIEVAPQKIAFEFRDYDSYQEFIDESRTSFRSERRFTYTPIIMCKGIK